MSEGYENFTEFLKKEYVCESVRKSVYKIYDRKTGKYKWSDETNIMLADLTRKGIPAHVLDRLLGIPYSTILKKQKDILINEDARFSLIKKWYSSLTEGLRAENGLVSIDDFLGTYPKNTDKLDFLLDSLFMLKQGNIIFPYTPSRIDAYLFGVNFGNGTLDSSYTLYFTGNDCELNRLINLIPVETSRKNETTIVAPACLGRLYYIMGLPKGKRQKIGYDIPLWIQERGFQKDFIAGFFDTTLSFDRRISFLRVNMYSREEVMPHFEIFLRNLAEMIRKEGIELSRKKSVIFSLEDETLGIYSGRINILCTSQNMVRIGQLPLRFERTRKIFKSS